MTITRTDHHPLGVPKNFIWLTQSKPKARHMVHMLVTTSLSLQGTEDREYKNKSKEMCVNVKGSSQVFNDSNGSP
jgi:hypothetical protein